MPIKKTQFFFALLLGYYPPFAQAEKFDCTDLLLAPVIERTVSLTPTGDFPLRDSLPRTEIPRAEWSSCCGSYGPCALPYPEVIFPCGIDIVAWSRMRVVEAAKKLIGVPYGHHHIPEMGGLDCSNFTALVYNYSFGIRFTSRVDRQSREVGRLLAASETPESGDLIFLFSRDRSHISHVVLYVSPDEVIDSTGPGVRVRPFRGWYKENYAWTRRLLE
jgi:hypothetical protein